MFNLAELGFEFNRPSTPILQGDAAAAAAYFAETARALLVRASPDAYVREAGGPRVRVELRDTDNDGTALVFMLGAAAARHAGGAVSYRAVTAGGRHKVVFHFHNSRLQAL